MSTSGVSSSEESFRDVLDRDFTRRLNNGDRRAFSDVYDAFAEDIFRHVRFRVRVQAQADEIAQQTFLKVWEQWVRDGVSIKSIRALLYTAAQNLIIDWYRRQDRRPEAELTEAVRERLGDQEQLSSAIDDAMMMEYVEEALGRIHNDYRDMILWRFVDELDVEDISDILVKTPNNIYVITHRALEALRKELESLLGQSSEDEQDTSEQITDKAQETNRLVTEN